MSHSAVSPSFSLDDSFTGPDGLLTQALLTGRFEQAVDLCFHEGRTADAIVLANTAGPALLQKTMEKYFKQSNSATSKVSKWSPIAGVYL